MTITKEINITKPVRHSEGLKASFACSKMTKIFEKVSSMSLIEIFLQDYLALRLLDLLATTQHLSESKEGRTSSNPINANSI